MIDIDVDDDVDGIRKLPSLLLPPAPAAPLSQDHIVDCRFRVDHREKNLILSSTANKGQRREETNSLDGHGFFLCF